MSKYILFFLFAPSLSYSLGVYRHYNTNDSDHSFPVEYISAADSKSTQLCYLQNLLTTNINYFSKYQTYSPNCINSPIYKIKSPQNSNIK